MYIMISYLKKTGGPSITKNKTTFENKNLLSCLTFEFKQVPLKLSYR